LKDRFIGSIDVVAAARVAYLLQKKKKRPGYSEMSCAKSNCFDCSKKESLLWTMDENGDLAMEFATNQFDAEGKKTKREEKEETATRWILDYFSQHGTDDPERGRTVRRGKYTQGDDADGIWVAAKNNDLLARNVVKDALAALRVQAWHSGKDYYYSLPNSEAPSDL
jgi:hypothetical protein